VANPSPERISVRTPPPITVIASRENLNHLDDVTGNNVNSSGPQASVRESSTEQAFFGVPFAQEPLVELDDAMEIDLENGDNLCRIY